MQQTKLYIPKPDGNKIPAVKYLLPDTDHSKQYPLVIFLHGAGEVGDGSMAGLDRLYNNGNHKPLLTNAEQRGFLVLAPQFVQAFNSWQPDWKGATYVDAVVEWAIANMPIDSNRIYLTGLSAGGGGTWDYLIRDLKYTSKIAAAVPVCPAPQDGNWQLIAQAKVPVWSFHAKDDPANPVSATIGPITLLNEKFAANPVAKMTLYESGGHGIWSTVYSTAGLYDWLLAQKSTPVAPLPAPAPAKTIVARLFVAGLEVIVYSDKTAEVK